MLLARGLLLITGIIFIAYGMQCALDPAVPAGYAGFELSNSGAIEVIAMYGGLQLAVGMYLAYSGLSPQRAAEGIKILVVITAGLALFRCSGIVRLGVDNYNLAAAIYEGATLALALLAQRMLKRS